MWIYIILIFIVISTLLLAKKNKKLKILPVILLIIFSGFRYGVGVDYQSYYNIYYNLEGYQLEKLDLGYRVLCETLKFLNMNFQSSILITSLLINILFYKWIKKYSENYFFSILIYLSIGIFFLNSLNAIRQFIAIGSFLMGLGYIEEKNRKKYYINILIGSLFHSSCLVLLIFYDILNIKLKKRYYILSLVGIYFIVKYSIFNLLLQIIPKYNIYSKLIFIPKITFGYYILFLLILMFILFKDSKFIRNENLYFNNFFIGASLMIISLNVSIVYRFAYYFLPGIIILVPNAIEKLENRQTKNMAKLILLASLIVLYMLTLLKGETQMLIPYQLNLNLWE